MAHKVLPNQNKIRSNEVQLQGFFCLFVLEIIKSKMKQVMISKTIISNPNPNNLYLSGKINLLKI